MSLPITPSSVRFSGFVSPLNSPNEPLLKLVENVPARKEDIRLSDVRVDKYGSTDAEILFSDGSKSHLSAGKDNHRNDVIGFKFQYRPAGSQAFKEVYLTYTVTSGLPIRLVGNTVDISANAEQVYQISNPPQETANALLRIAEALREAREKSD